MDYETLHTSFIQKMSEKGLTDRTIRAFDSCDNLEELIYEVSLRISSTEGSENKAARYILQNLF